MPCYFGNVFDKQALQSPDYFPFTHIFAFIQDAINLHCHVSIQDVDEKLPLCSLYAP